MRTGSIQDFYVVAFCFVLVGFLLSKKTLFTLVFAIPFAMLIHLVYLTYGPNCDRLQWYHDTDLASLNKCDIHDLDLLALRNLV